MEIDNNSRITIFTLSIFYSQKNNPNKNPYYDLLKAEGYYNMALRLPATVIPAEYLQQSIALHQLPGNFYKEKLKLI